MKNQKWLAIGGWILVLIAFFGGTWMMVQNGVRMPMPMVTGMDPWPTAIMQILMLVGFALAIACVVSLVIWATRTLFGFDADKTTPTAPTTPDEILRRRFAEGEISREQFDEMRTVLRT